MMSLPAKFTYEFVREYIESFGYTLLSKDYNGSKSKVEVQCDKCHPPYLVAFNAFRQGARCRKCSTNARKTSMDVIGNYVSEQCTGYMLLSDKYEGRSKKLRFQCPKGHVFMMSWSHLKRGQRCPSCRPNIQRSFDEVKEYMRSFGYSLLSQHYSHCFQKLDIVCPHGHKFKMDFSHFTSGNRCAECAGVKKKTVSQVSSYMNTFGYKLVSKEYKNAYTKLTVRCPVGHMYDVTWTNFHTGKRCPRCTESKGEEKVRKCLESHSIQFVQEHSFPACRNIEPLRFDFAIYDKHQKLILLVEYDGEYHYLPIEGQRHLKHQQKLDSIKNTYCSTNSIPLLRIPYTQFDNIEAMLSAELSKHNLLSLASN